MLLRFGRMNLPFGLRTIEHTMFIHSPNAFPGSGTRDDISSGQEDGASLWFGGEKLRGELMAIAGNYQINPDQYRERGYSGYLEYAPSDRATVGLSSLVTHANRDLYVGADLWRQAHGLFARFVPTKPIVVLAELDALLATRQRDQVPVGEAATAFGHASMLQADVEPWQGLHFILTGETTTVPISHTAFSYGTWQSIAWFFAPHADVRFDVIEQSLATSTSRLSATTLLAQLHVFL
jgi:hypothetical protein